MMHTDWVLTFTFRDERLISPSHTLVSLLPFISMHNTLAVVVGGAKCVEMISLRLIAFYISLQSIGFTSSLHPYTLQ